MRAVLKEASLNGIYLLLLVVGVGLYVPTASHLLYHVDSIGFAQAIHHFNMRLHQPPIPGFPLYVLTLRGVKALTHASDVACIVTVSIAATISSGLLFYTLARQLMGDGDAGWLTVLLLTSPVVWFNADISFSYATALLSSLAVACAAFALLRGAHWARYATPILWGLAAGFRQDVGLMLAPLIVYGARRELWCSRRYVATFTGLAVLTPALWFIPLVEAAGGLRRYFGMLRGVAYGISPLALLQEHRIRDAMVVTVEHMAALVVFLVIGALGVLVVRLLHLLERGPTLPVDRGFLAVWLLPGVALHLVTTIGTSGFVLPYLPPLLLLLAPRPATPEAGGIARRTPRVGVYLLGIAAQVLFFLALPQPSGLMANGWIVDTLVRNGVLEPTRSRIDRYDNVVSELVTAIRRKYPADQTLLIVPVGDTFPHDLPFHALYGHGQYYLPGWEQRVLYTTPLEVLKLIGISGPTVAEVNISKFNVLNTRIVSIPRSVRWLVWFCDVDSLPYAFDTSWTQVPLGRGVDLVFADLAGMSRVNRQWGPFVFRPER